ncbi:MAG TPA: alpha/beta hydrolase [Candidatus Lumbricidophila sp.]|nr:alpha/beta hydrolase [Candidatus Lumbricidophila sp.]
MATFTDAFGIEIHYQHWRVEHPRAVVQLSHGVGEHSGRYAHVIAALNAAGYSVWANDHRGHGETGRAQWHGDLSKIGQPGPGGMKAALAAVEQFTELIRETEGDLPLVLLGHSWGSLMGQIMLNRHPERFAAVVLTGTAYRVPGYMDAGNLNRRHQHLGTTGVEWLSRDPAVSAAFVADPLCTPTPLIKLFGPIGAFRMVGIPKRHLPDVPVLIMIGGDDTLGGERSGVRLLRSLVRRGGLRDVELVVYPGARHEVFNETNREEVLTDLIAWLDDRFTVRT